MQKYKYYCITDTIGQFTIAASIAINGADIAEERLLTLAKLVLS
jgi:hypothetical protein